MAIRNVTDCKGPVLGYKEGNCLSKDSTVAIRKVTDC